MSKAREREFRRNRLRCVESGSVTVACPECGRPATVLMHAVDDDRFEFEFSCPDGHVVPADRAQDLWIAAHQ